MGTGMSNTYRTAGVDISAGEDLVHRISPIARSTFRPGVIGGLGGFGAVFDPKEAGYEDPLIVTTTDGVGTKLRIAIDSGIMDTIGIDLVAMCVNDLIVQGAKPLTFLDYYATGHLNVDQAAVVISGIANGCRIAGCSLVGGETAEMPGMYSDGDFDLAGFAVGAVERGDQLPGSMEPGDVILGLASSGFHSNGFSLVRKVISGLDLGSSSPWEHGKTLAESLLVPTRIYVNSIMLLVRSGLISAAAHITGGGLASNLERVLPPGIGAEISIPWPPPEPFRWLSSHGHISDDEMLRVFNCGIGMVVVIPENNVEMATYILEGCGERVTTIGRIIEQDSCPIVRVRKNNDD
jgi:phosphoribosylformylglycinamidine cyclo-ligase